MMVFLLCQSETRTCKVVTAAGARDARHGIGGDVEDIGALARVVVDGAAGLRGGVAEARRGARRDLGNELVDALGGDYGREEREGDGLELHFGR